jgi:hypothetical protein
MPTFTIKFNIDPPNVQQAMDAINASLKNVGVSVEKIGSSKGTSTLDDGFVKLGLRLQGVTQMFNVAKSTFGSFIDESNAGEKATAKLTQALQNQGVYTPKLVSDLQQFAAARQQMTGIDDDATVSIMGMLTAMGLQGQALKDATVATQDLSSLMDGDMQGAVKVIASAFDGDAGMLKKYIKGLDEADIKQRGMISIIEQMTKSFGGQAEAMGNTGAGAIAKFDANWNDLKQSMGDILKSALVPVANLLSVILKSVIDGGPVMHTFALGVVALATAFTVLGTSMGGLPFIIGGIVTGAVMLIQWLKGAQEETQRLAQADVLAAQEMDALTTSIAKLKAEAGKSSEIDELQKKIDKLRNPDNQDSLAAAFDAAKTKAEAYKAMLNEAEPVLQKVLAYEKQGKDAREVDKDLAEKYFKIFSDGSKTAQQQIKELADKTTQATKDMKAAELALETYRKSKSEDQKKASVELNQTLSEGNQKTIERSKTTQELVLDNEEKALKLKTTSEEEKDRIAAQYAVKRIELERDTAIQIAKIEIQLLKTQQGVYANDPLKVKDLQSRINQINKDIATARANASKKIEGVGLDTSGKDAERKKEDDEKKTEQQKELAADNAQYLAQKKLDDKRRELQEQSNDSYLSGIKKLDAAKKKLAADEKKYLAETDKVSRASLKSQLDLDKEEVDSLEAGSAAKLAATEQDIAAGLQQFDANKNLGDQMKDLTRNTIKRLISEAVITQIAKVITTLPFPINVILAPIAGLALSALMEAAIPKFGGGGSVEGPDGIDNVPAMLTRKEFVMRREIAEPNRRFLEAMNAGQVTVARHAQGGSVGTVSAFGIGSTADLKKEFALLRKQMKKFVPQVNIFASTDMSKYDKTEKRLQRTRAAFAL